MFVLEDEYRRTWPVKVKVETAAGKTETKTFNASFKVPSMRRIRELVGSRNAFEADEEMLRGALIGWQGIVGPDKEPILFSSEARDRLLDVPIIRVALARALQDAISDQEKN
jgi:hypothetical protein